jgi:DUF1680 family protein
VHLYATATIKASIGTHGNAHLSLTSDYPWSGAVKITVDSSSDQAWTLALRVPDWSRQATTLINDAPVSSDTKAGDIQDGYIRITRTWQAGDVVTLDLTMQPELLMAHPRIDPARASVALRRGPLIYCLEDVDQSAGVHIEDVTVGRDAEPVASWQPNLLHGITVLQLEGTTTQFSAWGDDLYRPVTDVTPLTGENVQLTAIPYYAWANRGTNAMRVWIPISL